MRSRSFLEPSKSALRTVGMYHTRSIVATYFALIYIVESNIDPLQ
jgi:hypothetical protein